MGNLGPCETCGAYAVGTFGMDNTPLCAVHLKQADANYEGAVRDLVENQPDERNEHEVKQVLLVRRDLKMRRGKEIAQGSHASIAFLTNAVHDLHEFAQGVARDDAAFTDPIKLNLDLGLSKAAWQWIDGQFTKVTLMVWSEEELLEYHQKALDAGLESHVIQDSGRTEFGGKPTYTVCAIGPDFAADIDKITGDLRLY